MIASGDSKKVRKKRGIRNKKKDTKRKREPKKMKARTVCFKCNVNGSVARAMLRAHIRS